jgi:serine/threonine-protein kinase
VPVIPSAEEEDAHAAATRLLGTTLGGRYRIRAILGEGGMGTVFEAEHLALGRAVAVKILHPTQARRNVAVKRFNKEARSAGTIGHPNICEVYDIGELEDGSPFLVMERLVGETFADLIGRTTALPVEEVVDIMLQVLSGLHAAHEKGILHRDIKPENIFLNTRVGVGPLAKLLDFGVAKEMGPSAHETSELTQAGMVMGTPFYLSPEQARGERDLDQRTDIYACGVVLYESLAGVRPFNATNYNGLLRAILLSEPIPLDRARPDLPAGFAQVVMRAMARDRADRYANCVELQEALLPYHARISSRSLPNPSSKSAPPAPPAPSSPDRWEDDATMRDPLSQQFRSPGVARPSAAQTQHSPQAPDPPPPASEEWAPVSLDLDFDEETVRTSAPSEIAREMREQIRRQKKV